MCPHADLESDALPSPKGSIEHPMKANRDRKPSATYSIEDGSLRRAPARKGAAAFTTGGSATLRSRDPRKRLDLQISRTVTTGKEWCIEARGWRYYVDGSVQLSEVMGWINRPGDPRRPLEDR
jgi:hypothetical protein